MRRRENLQQEQYSFVLGGNKSDFKANLREEKRPTWLFEIKKVICVYFNNNKVSYAKSDAKNNLE